MQRLRRDGSSPLGEAAACRRIERDLHDGAQNALVALRVRLGLAAELAADGGDAELHRMLVRLGEDAQAALDSVRAVAHGAFPPLLTMRGVADALTAEAEQAVLPVRVSGRVPRSTPETEAAVYYCCLEALQNAVKHAGDDARVTIRLAHDGGVVTFAVTDDGAGFAPPSAARDGGLAHLRERAAAAGGLVTIVSRPGGGTTVRGVVPWPAHELAA